MSVLSKLLDLHLDYSTPYNCYELAHVWDPDCMSNAIDFTTTIFLRCCGLYFPLFAATHVLTVKKYDLDSLTQTGFSVIRSSAFIANHVLTFFTLFCGSRALLGKFYFTVHAFPITFLISYLSLKIEKKSRRGPLALYVLNIGSECLLRLLADRGLLPKIPHAPVLLFTLTMSALLYFIKKEGYGSDPASFVLKLVLGNAEAKRRTSRRREKELEAATPDETPVKGQFGKIRERTSALDVNFNELIPSSLKPKILKDLGKHATCRHKESCLDYSVSGFMKPFLGAWIGSSGISIAKEIVLKPAVIRNNPTRLLNSFADLKSIQFGLFMGSFAATYKAVNCYLRHRYNGPQDWHAAVGGLLAGPTMLIHPHSTIALYFFWKLVETLFVKSVKKGYITQTESVINVVYALSVSQIAYCVLLQPKYMRPSYMRLADIVTGHKFHLLNRCFCPFLVPDAIEGYEDYFADLDPKYCTDKFMETVMPWVLETKAYCKRS